MLAIDRYAGLLRMRLLGHLIQVTTVSRRTCQQDGRLSPAFVSPERIYKLMYLITHGNLSSFRYSRDEPIKWGRFDELPRPLDILINPRSLHWDIFIQRPYKYYVKRVGQIPTIRLHRLRLENLHSVFTLFQRGLTPRIKFPRTETSSLHTVASAIRSELRYPLVASNNRSRALPSRE